MRNNIYARAIAVVLCALVAAPALPVTKDKLVVPLAKSAGEEEYTRQVNPTSRLDSLFPEADAIGIAVAIVPDPLVPRYRRLYDHAIVAMELGMLRNGYVLDRYYLPWNQKLRSTDDSKHAGASNDSSGEHQATTAADPNQGDESQGDESQGDESAAGLPFNRGAYGLLLFRCDAWRHVEDPPPDLEESKEEPKEEPKEESQPQAPPQSAVICRAEAPAFGPCTL